MMENITEFRHWLDQCLKDGKDKLGITDETMTWILAQLTTYYYFRTLGKCQRCPHALNQKEISGNSTRHSS